MPRARATPPDPIAWPPRGLRAPEAARYVGVGETLFRQLVEQRRMPRPIKIGAVAVWDRHALDAAFAALDDADTPPAKGGTKSRLDALLSGADAAR